MRLFRALCLSIGIASVARAGLSYLPLTGPPALRFLVVRTPQPVPTVEGDANAGHARTNTVALSGNTEDCTNAAEATAGGAAGSRFPAISLGAGSPVDLAPGAPIFTMPSQDMPGMSPEMVAAYFQPVVVGTNGVAIPGQFRVGFIPPLPDPDKSSHAEYNVK